MNNKEYHIQYRKNNRQNINQNILSYYKQFPWRKTLVVIKQRCNNPNNKSYKDYGERGIKCLISSEELKILYFRDNAKDMKNPTIDRIDNDGDYCLENCRYIEKSLNSTERNIRASSVPILQYDLEGNFMREWKSIKQAQHSLNIYNIWHCLNGKYKQSGGYIWRYKNESL